MRRAMHRPEERVDLDAYSRRVEQEGQKRNEAAAAGRQGAGQDGGSAGKPLKNQIRDLERRLKRGGLPPVRLRLCSACGDYGCVR
eukprot:COSAG05_NODE_8348_length_712_cov_1.024470_1_plen_85_part_00